MLTKKELQWLDNRGKFSCWYCPDIPQAMCAMGERPAHCAIMDTDWKDAAEFEVRVAALLAQAYAKIIDVEFDMEIRLICEACPATGSCNMDCCDSILKWARLQVEEEMDNG